MSSFDPNFKIETFEEYFGCATQVKRYINECDICSSKLIHSHVSDYKNLCLQETSDCPSCGHVSKKKVHIIN